MLEYYDALYDKHLVNKLGMGTDSDRDRTGTNIRCEYPFQGDIHLLVACGLGLRSLLPALTVEPTSVRGFCALPLLLLRPRPAKPVTCSWYRQLRI